MAKFVAWNTTEINGEMRERWFREQWGNDGLKRKLDKQIIKIIIERIALKFIWNQ